MDKVDNKKENNQDAVEIATDFLMSDTINVEGKASGQMIQAYKGERYGIYGEKLSHQGRSLKEIKSYKLNPRYRETNIKQQSGFSAELIKEARDNQDNIRKGLAQRTRTSDGIGNTNDMRHDHVVLDKNGQVIDGSGSQMKFYGTDKKASCII